jgi:Glu-tRNA(Gln) amidotransferase subunit E-like FAD-binding protein
MVESNLSEAVKLCLDNWTALKLALDMGWGETESKSNFQTSLINYIVSYEVNEQDVTSFLEEHMEDNFQVLLEDNSSQEIARILVKVYEESYKGETTELQKLRKLQGADTDQSRKEVKVENLEQAMGNLEVAAPDLVPIVDEDGFETVVSKRNKRNK